MILSRVIKHMKGQHWTAVFLDFVIVVAGVFLANQVSTWTAAAELSRRKAAALERLHSESETVIGYLAQHVSMFTRQKALHEEALQRLSDNHWDGANKERMQEAFDTLDLAPAASPPRSVYDELISTGLFAELGDARLRDAVTDYYAYLSFLQGQIEYTRNWINADAAQRKFKGVKFVFDRNSFRDSRAEYDWSSLSGDTDFVQYAILRNADEIAQLQWWSLTLKKAQAMCAEIARFDGRPCEVKSPGNESEIFGAQDPRKTTSSTSAHPSPLLLSHDRKARPHGYTKVYVSTTFCPR